MPAPSVLWANEVQSGWVFYVVLGLPGYVLGELFFGWLLSSRHGLALSRAKFSVTRIAAAPLRVTQVYERDGADWKIVHRHADPLVARRDLAQTRQLFRP